MSVDDKAFRALGRPDELESLDTKLAAGLMQAQRGGLGRHITIEEQAMAKARRRLNGRHGLTMVYDYQGLDEAQNAGFGIETILAVQLVGDKLPKFLNDWNSILAGQVAPVSEALLKHLMLRQLRKRLQLKE